MLLDKGFIKSLNDKISKYLPKFSYIKCFNKISILQCLLHTSGITDIRGNEYFNKNKIYTINEYMILIKKLKLFDNNFFQKYNYSSTNYLIIGKICDNIIESSTKYIKQNIFNKLNMKNTYFIDDIYNKQNINFAKGYDKNFKKYNIPIYLTKNFYGINICSTFTDVNKFIINRHKLISKKNINLLLKDYNISINIIKNNKKEIIKNQKVIIGGRTIIINKKNYILIAGHFPGYHVSSIYSIDFKTIINTFSNIDKSDNIYNMDELAKQYIIILTTKYKFYFKTKIKEIKNYDKYIGRYENDYTYYIIYKKNNKLYLYSRKQTNELFYLGYNKFFRNNFSQIIIKNNILYVHYYFGISYKLNKVLNVISFNNIIF